MATCSSFCKDQHCSNCCTRSKFWYTNCKWSFVPIGCCVEKCVPFSLGFCSIVTCQWLRPIRMMGEKNERCKGESCYEIWCLAVSVLLIICAVLAILISIVPIGVFIAGWVHCPFTHYNICYTLELYRNGSEDFLLPKIVLRDTNEYKPGECNL